jgi:NitT/TauT family transport system substrate-binding protein
MFFRHIRKRDSGLGQARADLGAKLGQTMRIAGANIVKPIRLAEPFRAVFYAPFYIAERRGFYAKHGVEVTRATAGDPNRAAEALLADQADVAWSGPMRVILMRAADPTCPLRSFCAVVMRDPFLLVGRGPNPGFALTDLPKLRFGSVKEVPTPWWCLQDDLRQAGIDPDALARVTDKTMAENAEAVADGSLDVAQMFEPFATRLEAKGGAVWHRASDRGPSAYTALYATEANIQRFSAEFEAMTRGLADALAFVYAAPAAEIAASVAPLFPDVEAPVLTAALARYQAARLWPETPHFPEAAFTQLRGAMKSAGVIGREPSFDECVDPAIVARALGK